LDNLEHLRTKKLTGIDLPPLPAPSLTKCQLRKNADGVKRRRQQDTVSSLLCPHDVSRILLWNDQSPSRETHLIERILEANFIAENRRLFHSSWNLPFVEQKNTPNSPLNRDRTSTFTKQGKRVRVYLFDASLSL